MASSGELQQAMMPMLTRDLTTASKFKKFYTGKTILGSQQFRGPTYDEVVANQFVLASKLKEIDRRQWGTEWSTRANKYGLNQYARHKIRELGAAWVGQEVYDERLDTGLGSGCFYPLLFDLFTTLCVENSAYPTNYWLEVMAIWQNYSTNLDSRAPTTLSVTEVAAHMITSPWFQQSGKEKAWIATTPGVKAEVPADDPPFEVTCGQLMSICKLTAGTRASRRWWT